MTGKAKRAWWVGAVMLALGPACTEENEPLLEDAGLLSVGPPVRAHLRGLKGTVRVKRWNGDDWVAATEAMELFANDKVRTTAGSQARIEFISGGSMSLAENASLGIAESNTRPGLDRTDVTLHHGRLDAELSDAQKQSLSVTTPSATVRAGREIIFQ